MRSSGGTEAKMLAMSERMMACTAGESHVKVAVTLISVDEFPAEVPAGFLKLMALVKRRPRPIDLLLELC